jgi:pimeloyl-ACP methyl ester carboxylesterase
MPASHRPADASSLTFLSTPDGSRIAVHDFGGQGSDLVLVHATGLHGWVFAELAQHLDGYHCFAVDLRGHGLSEASGTWKGEWSGFAEDLATVVAGLGLEGSLAFGHSCGGATILLTEEALPGTFSAIYCYEPIVGPFLPAPPPSLDNPMSQAALRRRSEFVSKQDALVNFSSKPPLNALSAGSLRAYVEHGFEEEPGNGVRLRCRRETEASVFAHAMAHEAFGGLPDISCPVHLACGGRTDTFGEESARQLASRFASGGRQPGVTVFDDLGHFGPLEQPEAVAKDIASVFSEH